jgi:hypothetical protein
VSHLASKPAAPRARRLRALDLLVVAALLGALIVLPARRAAQVAPAQGLSAD